MAAGELSNVFTQLREEIEDALANSAVLKSLGVAVRRWRDPKQHQADRPSADLVRWVRVDTSAIRWDPFWANATTQYTHTLQIVAVLPKSGGLKLGDIEAMAEGITLALAQLCFGRQVGDGIPGLESLKFEGGDIGLAESDLPRSRGIQGDQWSQVGTVTAVIERPIADMIPSE